MIVSPPLAILDHRWQLNLEATPIGWSSVSTRISWSVISAVSTISFIVGGEEDIFCSWPTRLKLIFLSHKMAHTQESPTHQYPKLFSFMAIKWYSIGCFPLKNHGMNENVAGTSLVSGQTSLSPLNSNGRQSHSRTQQPYSVGSRLFATRPRPFLRSIISRHP